MELATILSSSRMCHPPPPTVGDGGSQNGSATPLTPVAAKRPSSDRVVPPMDHQDKRVRSEGAANNGSAPALTLTSERHPPSSMAGGETVWSKRRNVVVSRAPLWLANMYRASCKGIVSHLRVCTRTCIQEQGGMLLSHESRAKEPTSSDFETAA